MSIETVTVVLGDRVKVVSTGSTGPRGETGVVDPSAIEIHRVDTTDVHGIGDTGLLETLVGAQAKADAALVLAEAYADAVVEALVGAAPEALNALYELAAALGNDPNFATTVNAAIAARATQVGLDAEAAARIAADLTKVSNTGDTMSGDLAIRELKLERMLNVVGWVGLRHTGVVGSAFETYLMLATPEGSHIINGLASVELRIANANKLRVTALGVGLNGNAPVAKAAAINQPAGGRASVKAAIDAILASLGNIGITDAPVPAALTEQLGTDDYADSSVTEAKLSFNPATQVELDTAIGTRASQGALDAAIAARISGDNLRALLTDKRFNQIVQQVGWYLGVPGVPSSLALGTGLTGNIYVLPVTLGKPITIDQLWHNVTVAGGAGSFNELAVYGDNGNFWPGPLLAQVTVPTDVVGVALASIPPTVIPAGPVWLATRINTVTTSATVISIQGSQVGSLFPATNIGFVTTNYGGGLLTLNNAALPNPYFPENTPVAHFVVNGAPRVLMRRSA
jgi:hypothetical protein